MLRDKERAADPNFWGLLEALVGGLEGCLKTGPGRVCAGVSEGLKRAKTSILRCPKMGLNLYLKGLQAGSRAGLLEALGGVPRAACDTAARQRVGGPQAV